MLLTACKDGVVICWDIDKAEVIFRDSIPFKFAGKALIDCCFWNERGDECGVHDGLQRRKLIWDVNAKKSHENDQAECWCSRRQVIARGAYFDNYSPNGQYRAVQRLLGGNKQGQRLFTSHLFARHGPLLCSIGKHAEHIVWGPKSTSFVAIDGSDESGNLTASVWRQKAEDRTWVRNQVETGATLLDTVALSAIDAEGQRLAAVTGETTVTVWNLFRHRETIKFNVSQGPLVSLAWARDSELAAVDQRSVIQIWDVNKRKTIEENEEIITPSQKSIHAATNELFKVVAAASHPVEKNTFALVGSIGWASLYDGNTSSHAKWKFGEKKCHAVCWSPRGDWIATSDEKGDIVIWNPDAIRVEKESTPAERPETAGDDAKDLLRPVKRLNRLKAPGGPVFALAPNGDEIRLASGSADGHIRIWNVNKSELEHDFDGRAGAVRHVEWRTIDAEEYLLTVGEDGFAKIWNASTCELIQTLGRHADRITFAAWHPTQNRIATGATDHEVKIWDSDTGVEMLTLKGHTAPVTKVAWSLDGKRLASADEKNTIRVWNAIAGK